YPQFLTFHQITLTKTSPDPLFQIFSKRGSLSRCAIPPLTKRDWEQKGIGNDVIQKFPLRPALPLAGFLCIRCSGRDFPTGPGESRRESAAGSHLTEPWRWAEFPECNSRIAPCLDG